jgi:putative ABC transport system permease protein
MRLSHFCIHELWHRKWSFLAGVLGAAAAIASLVASLAVLERHDRETSEVLGRKREELAQTMAELHEEMRQATLKLSFNLVILPAGQELRDWYDKDYAAKYMPESYVKTLAGSGIVTVRHFLPSLQQRLVWPEHKRTIILVGSRDEVPNEYMNPVRPLVQPVPPGKIVLGHELHRSLGLAKGDSTVLMGRTFEVHGCHEQRGNKDDITAWIDLGVSQELLDKKGLINAILALECMCVGTGALPSLRKQITSVLPGTQVVERGSRVLARFEARASVGWEARQAIEQEETNRALLRNEKEGFATMIIAVLIIAGALWIAVVAWSNARTRRHEIGVLRAVGFRTTQILLLFLGRAFLTGLVGGLAGYALGVAFGGVPPQPSRIFLMSLGASVVLAVVACWIPSLLAASQDPANTLMSE